MITVRRIVEAVAAATGVSAREIMSDRRCQRVARPRFAVYWLADRLTPYSSGHIGRALNRDHTTILAGVKHAERLRIARPEFMALTSELLVRLSAEEPSPDPIAFGALTEANTIIIRQV